MSAGLHASDQLNRPIELERADGGHHDLVAGQLKVYLVRWQVPQGHDRPDTRHDLIVEAPAQMLVLANELLISAQEAKDDGAGTDGVEDSSF